MSIYPDVSSQLNSKKIASIVKALDTKSFSSFEVFTNANLQRELLVGLSAQSLDQQLALLLIAVSTHYWTKWREKTKGFRNPIWSIHSGFDDALFHRDLLDSEKLSVFQRFVGKVMAFEHYLLGVRPNGELFHRDPNDDFWKDQPRAEDIFNQFLVDTRKKFYSVANDVIDRVQGQHELRSVFISGSKRDRDGFKMGRIFEHSGVEYAHIGLFVPEESLCAVHNEEVLRCVSINWEVYLGLLKDDIPVVYSFLDASNAAFWFLDLIKDEVG